MARIGGEVETGTFQILNVGRDAFAVDTVHEEPEPRENLDATAELHPTEQRGVVASAYVVGIEITEYGRCTQSGFRGCDPTLLADGREVRHALWQRSEKKVVVGGADVGHFGCKTECHVVAREGYFVADHRRELEIVGVGAGSRWS